MEFISRLQTFVQIADAGSISQGARRAGLSVSVASRQLRRLEEELDTRLLHRSTRKIQLTEAGAALLERARQLLRDIDDTRQAVAGGGVRGSVTINVPVALGLRDVAPALTRFLNANPGLRMNVQFSDVVVDLIAENVDIAVRAGAPPPDSSQYIARKLATFPRVVCAAPSFLRAAGDITEPRRLESLACLIQGAGPAVWRFAARASTLEVRVDGPLRTNNIVALHAAALEGLGVAMLPLSFAREDLAHGRLVRLLQDFTPPDGVVHAIYHVSARNSPAVRPALDFLAAAISRGVSADPEDAADRER